VYPAHGDAGEGKIGKTGEWSGEPVLFTLPRNMVYPTHGDPGGGGSEGKTGEWSGQPVLSTLPRNIVYTALLSLMRTPQLPVVD